MAPLPPQSRVSKSLTRTGAYDKMRAAMALTINPSIKGIGGNPPTHIRVEGTVTGCEVLHVLTSCNSNVILVPIPTGGGNQWSIDVPNDKGCGCGTLVKVTAYCGLGEPSDQKVSTPLILICDPPDCCDEVTIAIDTQPIPCFPNGGGPIPIQFSATLSPGGCAGSFQWQVTNVTTSMVIQPYTPGISTFSYPFTGTGTYKVNVRVQQDSTCEDPVLGDSITFEIVKCTLCAVGISGPRLTPCTDGAPTAQQTYTATSTTPFPGPYTWEVLKDPNPLPFFQTQGVPSFPFAFPGPGTYTVTVSVQTVGCPNPTAGSSITVTVPPCMLPPCPPGQQRDASGNCVPIPGGFDVCCFVIWWWGISHLVAGSLLYYGLWWAGIISSAIATIVLIVWNAVCCWPCSLTFWRCCTLLKWVVMFNDALVVVLFALFAIGSSGIPVVLLVFGAISAIIRIAMSASNCGSIPNIFDPSTWPPCRCP